MPNPPLPPVTEEDMPAVKKMIERLVRLRKREAMHHPDYSPKQVELSDAIKSLIEYGCWHEWWKKQGSNNWWD